MNTSTPFFISGLSLVVNQQDDENIAAVSLSAPYSSSISSSSFSSSLPAAAALGSYLSPTTATNVSANDSLISSRRLQFPELDPLRTVATALPLILIVLCTVCGNMLVLLAVITTRKLRTATNYFIVNLAIADMMLGITVLPFSTTIEILDEYWVFGQALCDIWVTIDVLCCTASIYGLCVISVDRYIGVSKPLVHNQIVNKHRAILINAGVWFLAACICVVPFFGWRKSLSVEVSGRCEVNEDRAYVLFSATCSFFLPCTIVIIVYWRIYLKAVQQTRFMKLGYKEAKMATGENGVVLRIHTGASVASGPPPTPHSGQLAPQSSLGVQSKGSSRRAPSLVSATEIDTNLRQRKIDWTKFKRERRAARTLGIVVGVFIACWVPFFVILPTNAFCECIPPQIFKVVFWLGYCNSLMNPFIYGADSREFQMAFKRILCGKKSTGSYSSQSNAPAGGVSVSMVTRANRKPLLLQSVVKRSTTNSTQNGTGSSYVRGLHSTLPTPQEEENESFASDVGSTSACLKKAKSNASLNRLVAVSNGLLVVPSGAQTQPLLGDYEHQNEPGVDTTLLGIKRPSKSSLGFETSTDGDLSSRLLNVSTQAMSTSTASFKIGRQGSPAPPPEIEIDSTDVSPRAYRSSVELNGRSLKTILQQQDSLGANNNNNNKQDLSAPNINISVNRENSFIKQQSSSPTSQLHQRVTSVSSLSTLSSPSDSDDEDVKSRKRANRENRRKHFSKMSKSSDSNRPMHRQTSRLRRLSELFVINRTKRSSGGCLTNNSAGLTTVSDHEQPTPSSHVVHFFEDWAPATTNDSPSSLQLQQQQPPPPPPPPPTHRRDDLASLAFRRLLMVRFARRIRARSKARVGGGPERDDEQHASGTTVDQINNSRSGDIAASHDAFNLAANEAQSMPALTPSQTPMKPMQTLAPTSRWRTALSKITLLTASSMAHSEDRGPSTNSSSSYFSAKSKVPLGSTTSGIFTKRPSVPKTPPPQQQQQQANVATTTTTTTASTPSTATGPAPSHSVVSLNRMSGEPSSRPLITSSKANSLSSVATQEDQTVMTISFSNRDIVAGSNNNNNNNNVNINTNTSYEVVNTSNEDERSNNNDTTTSNDAKTEPSPPQPPPPPLPPQVAAASRTAVRSFSGCILELEENGVDL